MLSTKHKLGALVKELEFLDSGGYRQAMGWRPPLVFEDSPNMPKAPVFCLPHHSVRAVGFCSRGAPGPDHPMPAHSPQPNRGNASYPLQHREHGRH